jgi:hypothetical protein
MSVPEISKMNREQISVAEQVVPYGVAETISEPPLPDMALKHVTIPSEVADAVAKYICVKVFPKESEGTGSAVVTDFSVSHTIKTWCALGAEPKASLTFVPLVIEVLAVF